MLLLLMLMAWLLLLLLLMVWLLLMIQLLLLLSMQPCRSMLIRELLHCM